MSATGDFSGRHSGFSWEAARSIVKKCSVRPYFVDAQGRQVEENLRSRCRELLVRPLEAELRIDGSSYSARIHESERSDGGDLYHLVIRDASGALVGELWDVPAYGDILLAILGGNLDEAPEIPLVLEPDS